MNQKTITNCCNWFWRVTWKFVLTVWRQEDHGVNSGIPLPDHRFIILPFSISNNRPIAVVLYTLWNDTAIIVRSAFCNFIKLWSKSRRGFPCRNGFLFSSQHSPNSEGLSHKWPTNQSSFIVGFAIAKGTPQRFWIKISHLLEKLSQLTEYDGAKCCHLFTSLSCTNTGWVTSKGKQY